MTIAKTVLGVVPGLQATALVGHNLKLVQENFKMKPAKRMSMKKPIKRLVRTGVGTMVGIGLIKTTAGMINKL